MSMISSAKIAWTNGDRDMRNMGGAGVTSNQMEIDLHDIRDDIHFGEWRVIACSNNCEFIALKWAFGGV